MHVRKRPPLLPCAVLARSPMLQAHCQAEAEGLTLLKADNTTGYFGVNLHNPGKPKP